MRKGRFVLADRGFPMRKGRFVLAGEICPCAKMESTRTLIVGAQVWQGHTCAPRTRAKRR